MHRRAISCYLIGVGVALVTLAFAENPRSTKSASKSDARDRIGPEQGLGFGVDSSGDGDNVGSSNFCDDGTGHCTLRAAIQAANGHPGVDFIGIVLPASDPGCEPTNGTCTINVPRPLPDITEGVSIGGPGPRVLSVQRSTTHADFSIFNVATTSTVSLTGLAISNGFSGSSGGGINNNGATINVTNCTLSGNTATTVGGAISNNVGTMNILNSTISGNSVPRTGTFFTDGGGISNGPGATVNVTNSTLIGNSASNGGGIANLGILNVVNNTIVLNTEGGGIYNDSQGNAKVTNSTISFNTDTIAGGGIRNNVNATTVVKSSLIASNTGVSASPDVSGVFMTSGYNLIGKSDGSTGFTALTDLKGTVAAPLDAKLSNLIGFNGGPTLTVTLLFGSPAIDKGTSDGLTGQLTTDQRGSGFPRTLDDPGVSNAFNGDGTDIGAFEVQTVAPTGFANISTRLRVETGDNAMIGGFIITGTEPMRVILRAIGPSLPLTGVLANPILELHNSSLGLIYSNDDWRSAQEAEIIATTIPPTNDLESAMVILLGANNRAYTAIVRGANNGTGIGLVEAYDLDRSPNSKLGNISTRGLVQTGDDVLIAGTILLDSTTERVLVRAIGPSLTGFGIAGALQNPTLELHDQNGSLLRANDDWRSDQEAEIIATTIPPSNDLESAIVQTLPSGGATYTAIVRGVNNTTGVALVEIYALHQ